MGCKKLGNIYICSPTYLDRPDIKRKIHWTLFESGPKRKAILKTPDFGALKCVCCNGYNRAEMTDNVDYYWKCKVSEYYGAWFTGNIHGHTFEAYLD